MNDKQTDDRLIELQPQDFAVPEHFRHWPGAPAVNMIGPFFYDGAWQGTEAGETVVTAFRAREDHSNTINTVHGGVLMTFADYTLCMAALNPQFPNCATISINTDFVSPGKLGDLILGYGTLTRRTKSTAFTTCVLKSGDDILMNATGIIRVYENREGARRNPSLNK